MPCLFAKYVFPSVCKNCQASHPYQLSLLRAYEHLSKIIATPWALAAHAATSALRAIKLKVKLFWRIWSVISQVCVSKFSWLGLRECLGLNMITQKTFSGDYFHSSFTSATIYYPIYVI